MPKIFLAATGHRNLAPGDVALSGPVRRECRRLARTHPGTDFVVLSALAEGADRLVVEAAIAEVGATLIAVLPMPRATYEQDFASPASRREFAALLEKADKVVVAPQLSPPQSWRPGSEARDQQYAWAGAYVARNADVLFALWDGEPARGTGGTADVVSWFLAGRTPRRFALSRQRLRRFRVLHPPRLIRIDPGTGRIHRRAAEIGTR